MAAIATATKTYTVTPANGWTLICTGAVTPINFLHISADPHTHPIFIYMGAGAPAATVRGKKVCHKAFKFFDATNGTSSLVYVRVTNPSHDGGGVFVDVISEGGVLS